ncbi:MAG: SUMF1/EgtB/PvdO family nonheme iron enzyme [Treponema sp.]|jgi:formylglycine-generating enzyme required for sulfatase activity|nr:SUMF1/EgtB/PvdO family nonheme iron enzyme [Treponema sp.]
MTLGHSTAALRVFALIGAVCLFAGCPLEDSSGLPGIPSPPSVVSGDRRLSVSWIEQGNAEEYEIRYRKTDDPNAGETGIPVRGSTGAIENLENGRPYSVRVAARNNAGFGGFSDAVTGVPEAAALSLPADFVYIPGGTISGSAVFATGSETGPAGDQKGVFVEGRIVRLDSFGMAKYETTNVLWNRVRQWGERNGYTFAALPEDAGTGNEPATGITWRDAVVWCNAYSEEQGREPVYYLEDGETVLRTSSDVAIQKTGDDYVYQDADRAVMKRAKNGFRLPLAAEWEFAARGGDPVQTEWYYPYAGSIDPEEAGWIGPNSNHTTHPVGTKKENLLGIYDMTGNAYEWYWDWGGNITPDTPVEGPAFPGSARTRVCGGGYYGSQAKSSHVSSRMTVPPSSTYVGYGFRVACGIAP